MRNQTEPSDRMSWPTVPATSAAKLAATVALALLATGCAVDSATESEVSTPQTPPAAPSAPTSPAEAATGAIEIDLLDGSVPVVMAAVGGGAPVPLLLDTGSSGLRIFREDVGPQAVVDPATEDETISFVDGTTYVSDKAIAPVSLGSITLPAPVPVALVNDVVCEPGAELCEPGIAASKSSGVHGILGIDMDTGDYSLPSPLLYLPNFRSFTVTYADGGSGQLVPGLPSGDPVATWDLIEADSGIPDVAGWAQDFDACWSLKGNAPTCLPTSFDTGTTDVVLPATMPDAPEPSDTEEYLQPDQGPLELFADETAQEPVWQA